MTRSFGPSDRRRFTPSGDQQNRIRLGLVADVNTICEHLTAINDVAAERDVQRRPSGVEGGGSSSMVDLEEARARRRRGAIASMWLKSFDALRREAQLLAAVALSLDPPPAKDRKPDGFPVCVLCRQEIDPAAPDGKATRVDGHPLHRSTCYYQVYRAARKEGLALGARVAQLADRATAPTVK